MHFALALRLRCKKRFATHLEGAEKGHKDRSFAGGIGQEREKAFKLFVKRTFYKVERAKTGTSEGAGVRKLGSEETRKGLIKPEEADVVHRDPEQPSPCSADLFCPRTDPFP